MVLNKIQRALLWFSSSLILTLGETGAAPARVEALLPSAAPGAVTRARVEQAYGKLPLAFEANHGQTDDRVKFLSRGNGYTLFLTSSEAVLALRKGGGAQPRPGQPPVPKLDRARGRGVSVLRMQLVGANSQPSVAGLDELPGKSNYFTGNDPTKWRTKVPQYGKVKFSSIYSGIDLLYYGNQRQLEYDLVVAPGADPTIISFAFEGADRLEMDPQGDLVVHLTLSADFPTTPGRSSTRRA